MMLYNIDENTIVHPLRGETKQFNNRNINATGNSMLEIQRKYGYNMVRLYETTDAD